MTITILHYEPNIKGKRMGYFDFKVDHGNNKWEIFRDAALFKDEQHSWMNLGSCKRNEKWIPKYERSVDLKLLFKDVMLAMEEYLILYQSKENMLFADVPDIKNLS